VADSISVLLERIARRDFSVAIVGMGYVGLPLALAFVRQGFAVLGVDIDAAKVAQLVEGRSYLSHIDIAPLQQAKERGRFDATSDFDRLRAVDAVLLCVPTPVDAHQQPDLRFVRATSEAVLERLQPGQLVVLESTTYPGTTDELVRGILEQRGAVVGRDFYLAYSPEREDPGNARFATFTIPKLVGGVDPESGALAQALYRAAIAEVVEVSSARVAEAAKLTENIFRAVNIALVNELKVTFDRMGLDIWEVLDAASTKPFGFMRFNPGPGWGGHCIPVDPFYLSWKAREFGASPKFIELAGEINIRMHEYVVTKLVHALSGQGKALHGARVLLLGIAYKKNVDDCRESPAFPIMEQLERLGAQVSFHDDHVEEIPALREWPRFIGRRSVALDAEALRTADVTLIVTDHDRVDYAAVLEHAPLIVDSRGVYRRAPAHVVKA
jgi:UDP-N-acetyl-D-glucosamine dehydrogenase